MRRVRPPSPSDRGQGVLILGPWGYMNPTTEAWLSQYILKMPIKMPIRLISRSSGVAKKLADHHNRTVLYTTAPELSDLDNIKAQFADCALVLLYGNTDQLGTNGMQWARVYGQEWRQTVNKRIYHMHSNCRDYCLWYGSAEDVPDSLHWSAHNWVRRCGKHNSFCRRVPWW